MKAKIKKIYFLTSWFILVAVLTFHNIHHLVVDIKGPWYTLSDEGEIPADIFFFLISVIFCSVMFGFSKNILPFRQRILSLFPIILFSPNFLFVAHKKHIFYFSLIIFSFLVILILNIIFIKGLPPHFNRNTAKAIFYCCFAAWVFNQLFILWINLFSYLCLSGKITPIKNDGIFSSENLMLLNVIGVLISSGLLLTLKDEANASVIKILSLGGMCFPVSSSIYISAVLSNNKNALTLFHIFYAAIVFIYMVSAVIHLLRHKPNFEKAE